MKVIAVSNRELVMDRGAKVAYSVLTDKHVLTDNKEWQKIFLVPGIATHYEGLIQKVDEFEQKNGIFRHHNRVVKKGNILIHFLFFCIL